MTSGAPALGLLGGVVVLGAVIAAPLAETGPDFPRFLAVYLAWGAVYLAAVAYVLRRRPRGWAVGGVVAAVAIAARLALLPTPPRLSDDIYRYVWDGRVARHGTNPYRYAPEAPELAGLRDELYEGINHKEVPTIYPPLMQLAFLAVVSVSESLVAMKTAFVACDLLLAALLAAMLAAIGECPARVVVYAWSPLVVVEIAGNGHNDVLALLLLMAAHAALLRSRDLLAVVALGLSGMAKLVGFALAPVLAPSVRPRAWIALPAVALLLAWPYAAAGRAAFEGLFAYGARWRGNDSLFHVLYAATGSLLGAKLLAAAAYAGLCLWLVRRREPPLRAGFVALGALLLLTTTVHPWYLVWIVPYLCFFPSPAWLYLTLAVAIAYHAPYLSDPGAPWGESGWIKLLEYGPFFGLLAAGAIRRGTRAAATGRPGPG